MKGRLRNVPVWKMVTTFGMTQRAGRLRLGTEPAAQVLFVEPLIEELDGDQAIDVRIASQVDTPHAAAAEAAQHVELVDPLDGWRHHAGCQL